MRIFNGRLPPALAFALLLAGCGRSSELPRLVLLYATCTVNRHYLSPYNEEVSFTPNLQRFARDARVFVRHQTEAGQSGISYASIFTGRQSDGHGAFRHPVQLEDDLYLIAEAYADQGYETFFWHGHPMAAPALNYAQGVPPENRFPGGLRVEDPRFDRILKHLEDDPDYRAFIVTNFTVTHGPYETRFVESFRESHPEYAQIGRPEAERYARLYRANHRGLSWNFGHAVRRLRIQPPEILTLVEAVDLLYASTVFELDRMFGGVLDRIDDAGLRDESLVVFTADHGELLFRENAPFRWSHSMQLAPEVLGAPLLIRASSPGFEPGTYDGVTRSIDVFPTMAGLSGFALPERSGVAGVDLSPVLGGTGSPPELTAFSHTTVLVRSVFKRMHAPRARETWRVVKKFFPTESIDHVWVSMRQGDLVYKRTRPTGEAWETEVYDLATDPIERTNLFRPDDPDHLEATLRLERYKTRLVQAYRGTKVDRDRLLPQPEEQERLRSLGYIE